MSELAKTVKLLQARQRQEITPEAAKFVVAYTRLLAEGNPVSTQQLAEAVGDPIEFVTMAFDQMKRGGAEFNDKGELIGAALTLTPTRHQVVIGGITLYAWCALDTLFIPAFIGKTAQVRSTCPVTHALISLTLTPDSLENFAPTDVTLSIMTAPGCSSGINGTFCSQVNFFASPEAAQAWIGERSDFSILSAREAYQLAQQIYVEPVIKHA